MKAFRIGDFCDKVGVSPDFLKYQEEQGIIQPYLRSDANYRYYNVSHAGRVYATLRYKNLGFNSKEIKQMMMEKPSGEVMDMLSAKEAETEQQIVRLRYYLDHMRMIQECRRCEEQPTPWYIRNLGGYYYLPHFHRDDFLQDECTNTLVREWISWSPLVLSTQRIISGFSGEAGNTDEKLDYYWGFLAEEQFAKDVGLSVGEPVLYIPPHRCLLSYQNIVPPEPSAYSWQKMLKEFLKIPAQDVIRQCGFQISDDSYNVTLFYSSEEGKEHIHTQLIVPLSD
jgi:DNA-binding transcriptional MerR regulator